MFLLSAWAWTLVYKYHAPNLTVFRQGQILSKESFYLLSFIHYINANL